MVHVPVMFYHGPCPSDVSPWSMSLKQSRITQFEGTSVSNANTCTASCYCFVVTDVAVLNHSHNYDFVNAVDICEGLDSESYAPESIVCTDIYNSYYWNAICLCACLSLHGLRFLSLFCLVGIFIAPAPRIVSCW